MSKDKLTFAQYKADRNSKRKARNMQPASDQALRVWYNASAHYESSKGSEFVEANHNDAYDFWKSNDGKMMRKYRKGPMGRMDEALAARDWDTYKAYRKKLVRPLRRDLQWDGGPDGEITVRAGEIPPPRYASVVSNTGFRSTVETTRRGCAMGVRGLPCNHAVGSNECNGGVPLYRRAGDMY